MRTIICKRCGSPIDASLGECPVCGAVYYILPEDDPSEEPDETRVWQQDEAEKIYKAIERSERSDSDEPTHLFDSEEMKKIENCLHCNQCSSKCPYQLDTPSLLEKNYEDYKRVLAGEVTV